MDNRAETYLSLLSNGVNSEDAVRISKLHTMTDEEIIKECDNMIMLLDNSKSNLINLKTELLKK